MSKLWLIMLLLAAGYFSGRYDMSPAAFWIGEGILAFLWLSWLRRNLR